MSDDPAIVRLLDNARISLPGSTDGTLRIELMNVVEDFCRQTNCWQEDLPLTLERDKTVYDIFSPDANGDIWRLIDVQNANPNDPKWTASAWLPTPETFKIAFTPDKAMDLVLTLALTPSTLGKHQAWPGVPTWFWPQYGAAVATGLLGRMAAQPAKPYSNPQIAVYNLKTYIFLMQRYRIYLLHGRRYGAQTWRFPQSYAVRSRKY